MRKQIKNTVSQTLRHTTVGLSPVESRDRAVGDRARRAVRAARVRRGERRRTRAGHRRRTRRESSGFARAFARRAIQARETYRGHDESTALGGLAHLHSLEVGSAAGAGAGGGGPRDDARGHRGGDNSGHFSWCAVGMCSGACGYAGAGASPAFRVSRAKTRRVYPKAPNLPAKHTSLSKKGKRFDRVECWVCSRFTIVGSFSRKSLTGVHTKTKTRMSDRKRFREAGARVSKHRTGGSRASIPLSDRTRRLIPNSDSDFRDGLESVKIKS